MLFTLFTGPLDWNHRIFMSSLTNFTREKTRKCAKMMTKATFQMVTHMERQRERSFTVGIFQEELFTLEEGVKLL